MRRRDYCRTCDYVRVPTTRNKRVREADLLDLEGIALKMYIIE